MTVSRTSILFPDYMRQTDVWTDLADSVDKVLQTYVHDYVDMEKYLRSVFITEYDADSGVEVVNAAVATKVANREFLLPTDYDVFDSGIERLRLSHLGLQIDDPTIIDPSLDGITPTLLNSPLHRLTQTIGSYWYHKGLGDVIDYINYVLNTDVVMYQLWTTDYKTFYVSDDPLVGTPVWKGGTWYPTTHVRIDISASSISVSQVGDLVKLFYAVANYNLILESIAITEYAQIVDDISEEGPNGKDPAPLNVVGVGMATVRYDKISTPFYPGPPYI